jgi:hypothetical protein
MGVLQSLVCWSAGLLECWMAGHDGWHFLYFIPLLQYAVVNHPDVIEIEKFDLFI